MYREDKSGQVIRVTRCVNDFESETSWVEGEVLDPGVYKDSANATGTKVAFGFHWEDWTFYTGLIPQPPFDPPRPRTWKDDLPPRLLAQE